jgi:hypothetical protein
MPVGSAELPIWARAYRRESAARHPCAVPRLPRLFVRGFYDGDGPGEASALGTASESRQYVGAEFQTRRTGSEQWLNRCSR